MLSLALGLLCFRWSPEKELRGALRGWAGSGRCRRRGNEGQKLCWAAPGGHGGAEGWEQQSGVSMRNWLC